MALEQDIDFLCENLNVEFPIYDGRTRLVKSRISDGSITKRIFKALSNLNLTIRTGDRIGLIGVNGAGKSTFLRTLAGVYAPTSGRLYINTKPSSLFQIGVGTNPDMSGYENIPLLMALRQIPSSQLDEVIEDVKSFSELGDALAHPLRTYSAGMRLRIAFAVATYAVEGALLIDEVVGVGDAVFRTKSKKRLERLLNVAPTLLLASHSVAFLKSFCTTALVFERGEIMFQGPIQDAVNFYKSSKDK